MGDETGPINAAIDDASGPNQLNGATALPTDTDGATSADGAAVSGPLEADVFSQSIELFVLGGPVVIILSAMSVAALTITLAKLWQFGLSRPVSQTQLQRVLELTRLGYWQEALTAAHSINQAQSPAVTAALKSRLAAEHIAIARERAYMLASTSAERLREWLRPLEVIAVLAPLLGLLGTVMGMIDAFAALEAAGAQVDPSILSGGIWEALLTTAIGLAVAIPATAALNWFDRRVERFEMLMERSLGEIFTAEIAQTVRAEIQPDARLDRRLADVDA
ncbi:MAG: MotA/TolQ/ExbB proton channel family protein [Pseudomonadota bacterium]